jgi:hypothetical protein
MPASKGKALPLLRIINSFLRFLPRTPEDLVFRGRVHQFAGSVISVADKSAVNMRGDYNDIQTTWEADVEDSKEETAAKDEVTGIEGVEEEDIHMEDKADVEATRHSPIALDSATFNAGTIGAGTRLLLDFVVATTVFCQPTITRWTAYWIAGFYPFRPIQIKD